MDYRTEAHTLMASANLTPIPRLAVNMNASYTTGRGNITDLSFDSMYPTGDAKLDLDTSALNPNQPYLYDVAYINGMDDYSNLDFKELNVSLGVSYRVAESVGVGVNYYYTDFQDDEAYVYGDQDVEVQSLMGYVTFSF